MARVACSVASAYGSSIGLMFPFWAVFEVAICSCYNVLLSEYFSTRGLDGVRSVSVIRGN